MNINEIIAHPNHTLEIVFDDGRVGVFNIKPYLNYEVFEPLKEISEFMKVSNRRYFVEWECGADLSSDTLEAKMKLKEPTEGSSAYGNVEN